MSEHPNLEVLKRFDPTNVSLSIDAFAEDAVFHFYNPHLPDLDGDHVGRKGIQSFFEKLETMTGGAFKPNVVSVQTCGDELVVVHRKQQIQLEGRHLESDVVVVWRIVDGQIKEVWDIPSVHTVNVLDE